MKFLEALLHNASNVCLFPYGFFSFHIEWTWIITYSVKHPKLNLEKFIMNCFSFSSTVNILSIFSSIFPIIQSARGSKLMIYVLSFTLIENFLNDGVCQCALMRAWSVVSRVFHGIFGIFWNKKVDNKLN